MGSMLKPYRTCKPSGVEWLGAVPEHWEMGRGKWLFRKMDRPIQDADEVVTCFRDGVVTLRKNRRVHGFTESLKEIGYQGIRRGDLVIHGMDAFAGAIGVADSDGKGTPVYSVCEPRPTANARYYAYTLREMARSQWIQALAKGIRERSTDFRFDGFGSQSVPLPPLLEQAAIVRFLDHIDRRIRRYIRAKQKLITLLKEQKQALIHQAVTGQVDVRTGQPYPAYKPSGVEWLGDIPEHWEVRRVKSLSLVKRGASPRPIADPKYFDDDGEYAWVRIADVTASSSYLERTTQRLSVLGQSLSVPLEPGALFLSIAGSVGKPMITRIKCCIHDGFVYFPQFNGDVDFLYRVFAAGTLFARLGKLGTQLNLNTDTVGNILLGWPPSEEQAAIVSFLDQATADLDTATTSTQREISLLSEYRTRLIADVVTGKLDVRTASARLPDEVEEQELLAETDALIDSYEEPTDELDTTTGEAAV